MDLSFDINISNNYKSQSQIIRVLSEKWIANNMFCPCCGNDNILELDNNLPVADFICDNCGEIFELKSKRGKIGSKIADGAYSTMIERINSITNPELFVLQYTSSYQVTDLTLIPKFFFTPQIIEKRKPLSQDARRAGWVGCNILYREIPEQGRIGIIKNGILADKNNIVDTYKNLKKFQNNDIETRGWLFDVLNCINKIDGDVFTLNQVYGYCDLLKQLHVNNNNVHAKIRQQLQILRDKGIIKFVDRGVYKKL